MYTSLSLLCSFWNELFSIRLYCRGLQVTCVWNFSQAELEMHRLDPPFKYSRTTRQLHTSIGVRVTSSLDAVSLLVDAHIISESDLARHHSSDSPVKLWSESYPQKFLNSQPWRTHTHIWKYTLGGAAGYRITLPCELCFIQYRLKFWSLFVVREFHLFLQDTSPSTVVKVSNPPSFFCHTRCSGHVTVGNVALFQPAGRHGQWLHFFLAHSMRIAWDRARYQTVASRGKGPDFWPSYVEGWEHPPVAKRSELAKRRFGGWFGLFVTGSGMWGFVFC